MTRRPFEMLPGFQLVPGYFDREAQESLLREIRAVVAEAPLFVPRMPRTGTPFSVRMSGCGPLGWVSDQIGYRYQPTHPVTGEPWPPMPPSILRAWRDLCPDAPEPQACLVNFYGPDARMGLHQDRDEQTFDAPVLSISLGATAVFRIGGLQRRDPTRSFRLASGDVVVLGGAARLAHHGVDRIVRGTSELVRDDGRINLTLRRVTPPGP